MTDQKAHLIDRYNEVFVTDKRNAIVIDSTLRQMDELEFIKGEMEYTRGQMENIDDVKMYNSLQQTYLSLHRSYLSGTEMMHKYLKTLDERFSKSNDNKEIDFSDVFKQTKEGK